MVALSMAKKPRPGCIIKGTPIACDYWTRNSTTQLSLYFLSHAHADHMQGLTPSFDRPIYCSSLTAKILKVLLRGIDETFIHELEIDETHVIEYEFGVNPKRRKSVSVTVLDANHCPGAVMFLFEGEFGRILYTGDFRYEQDSAVFQSEQYQRLFSGNLELDYVYLDNTYWLTESCPNFPSRDEATEEIIKIINDHSDHFFIIGLTKFGKEELLCKIAESLGEKMFIGNLDKYELLQAMDLPDIFTYSEEESRIGVVSRFHITRELGRRKEENLIAILPSALPLLIPESFKWLTEGSKYKERTRWVVYSDHSSRSELSEFLKRLNVAEIIPMAHGMSFEEKREFLTERPNKPIIAFPLTSTSSNDACAVNSARELMRQETSDSADSATNVRIKRRRKQRPKEVSGRPKPRRSDEAAFQYMSSPDVTPKKKIKVAVSLSDAENEVELSSGRERNMSDSAEMPQQSDGSKVTITRSDIQLLQALSDDRMSEKTTVKEVEDSLKNEEGKIMLSAAEIKLLKALSP